MGQVNQNSNLLDQIKRLEREMQQVRKAIGLSSAHITGGGLKISGDGGLFIEDSSGNPICTVQGDHLFSFWDYNNDVILRADPAGGLAEPWLNIPMYPTFIPNISASSGGDSNWTTPDFNTEKTFWEGRIAQVTHPAIQVDGEWGYGSGGPGTATYRLYIHNILVGSWTATVRETSNHPFTISSFLHEQDRGIRITMQCSTNVGTAQVFCEPLGVTMRQSL